MVQEFMVCDVYRPGDFYEIVRKADMLLDMDMSRMR